MLDGIKVNTSITFTATHKSRTKDIDQESNVIKSWATKLFTIEEEDDEEKQLGCIGQEQDSLLQKLKETVQSTVPQVIRQYQPKLTKECQYE
jgi:hypothetical protein